MFKQLHLIAKDGALAMRIVAEGDKLRVTVQQSDDADTPLSITVLATPDELDAELPGAIAQAAGAPVEPKTVGDQVKEQLDRIADAKPSKAKKAATTPAAPKPAAAAKPAVDKKPGKPECLADYVTLKAKHGDKLTRDLFMKEAATGRRFERLWDNWTKFVDAGKRAIAKAAPAEPAADVKQPAEDPAIKPPNGDANTIPLPLDAGSGNTEHAAPQDDGGGKPPETTAGASAAQPADAAGTSMPATIESMQGEPGPGVQLHSPGSDPLPPVIVEPPAPRMRTVQTIHGVDLCTTTVEFPPGDTIEFGADKYRVRTMSDDTIFVDLIPAEPPPPVRKVIDDDGETAGTYTGKVNIGDEIDLSGWRYKVNTCTAKAIFVTVLKVAEAA